MSHVRLFCLLTFVLTPSLSLAQFAGVGAGAPAPGASKSLVLMKALDIDKDGTLSAKEIRAAVKALKTLDVNRDGKLTPEELVERPAMAPGAGAAGGAIVAEGTPSEGAMVEASHTGRYLRRAMERD